MWQWWVGGPHLQSPVGNFILADDFIPPAIPRAEGTGRSVQRTICWRSGGRFPESMESLWRKPQPASFLLITLMIIKKPEDGSAVFAARLPRRCRQLPVEFEMQPARVAGGGRTDLQKVCKTQVGPSPSPQHFLGTPEETRSGVSQRNQRALVSALRAQYTIVHNTRHPCQKQAASAELSLPGVAGCWSRARHMECLFCRVAEKWHLQEAPTCTS